LVYNDIPLVAFSDIEIILFYIYRYYRYLILYSGNSCTEAFHIFKNTSQLSQNVCRGILHRFITI